MPTFADREASQENAPYEGAPPVVAMTPAAQIVALQRSIGNRATARLLARRAARVARTPVSTAVEPLISYGATDWEVTAAEETSVLTHLTGDPTLSDTVRDLNASGMLGALVDRVDEPANRRALLRLLGSGCNPAARGMIEPHIQNLPLNDQLVYHLAEQGVTSGTAPFAPTPAHTALIGGPTAPFSGVGATGVNPTTRSVPLVDQALLAAGDAATTAAYSNPIPGSLPGYLASLSPVERTGQAELFLRREISSRYAAAYGGAVPSRAQIVRAAASRHSLEPALLAGFLLAEQRDQSSNEDAKDFTAATSLLQANTSIGLGQVVISTAQRGDLFADLISSRMRGLANVNHNFTANLLASDEFNIFAAARYLRAVANDGATKAPAALPNTVAKFPAIDFPSYANHSTTWPEDNIRALGSEYTSRAWDDNLSPGWGEFVYQAVLDCRASGAL